MTEIEWIIGTDLLDKDPWNLSSPQPYHRIVEIDSASFKGPGKSIVLQANKSRQRSTGVTHGFMAAIGSRTAELTAVATCPTYLIHDVFHSQAGRRGCMV